MRKVHHIALAAALILVPAAAHAEPPPVRKVYAIVTVIVKPGKDGDYAAMLKQDVAFQARSGLRLTGAYAIQFGVGNRHVQIWEADSAEKLRRAAFETSGYPADILDIVEREDIEIAVSDMPVDSKGE